MTNGWYYEESNLYNNGGSCSSVFMSRCRYYLL